VSTFPVAVLASRVRADEKRIFDALDSRGVAYTHLDSRTLWGTGTPEPPAAAVLNREISHFRGLYAARTLEASGAVVVNSASATDVCGDKWRTTLALREAGLPVPATALALTPQAAPAALAAVGYPAVIKPLVGSWGRLVSRIPDAGVAATVLDHIQALPGPQSHIVYVQELVDKPGRDIRAIVIGGEVIGATYRVCSDWRTNVARGAVTLPCPLTPELTKLATGAAQAVDADVVGVDLIEDRDGRLLVLEVNSGMEFSGFQHAMGDTVDVAGIIADYVISRAEPCFG
jgi:[lysine-biosynthesis-protein LysW]---L-2-aminoadipate ligase